MTVFLGGSPSDGAVTLTVIGEVDFNNVADLHDAISQAIADGAGQLRLDLSQASFMDSMGVAALVAAYRAGQRSAIPTVITAVHPSLHRVLWITGILSLFGADPEPGAAVTSGTLAAPPPPLPGLVALDEAAEPPIAGLPAPEWPISSQPGVPLERTE